MRTTPKDIAAPGFDAEMEARLRAERVTAIAQWSPLVALISLAACGMVAVTFWNAEAFHPLIFTGVLAAAHALAVQYSRRWLKSAHAQGASVRSMWIRAAFSALIAVIWGTAPLCLMPEASMDQQRLLFCVSICLISAGVTLAPILPAAFLFSGVMSLCLGVSLFMTMGHVMLPLYVALFLYTGLTALMIVRHNEDFTRRVTDKNKLEEQSGVIGLLLREFEESASDWLWEADEQLCFQSVSERLAAISGLSVAALTGMPLLKLTVGGVEVGGPASVGKARLAEFFSSRHPFRELLISVQLGETLCWWSLSGKPIFDRNGVFCGYRGVGTDVTAVKQSEARIMHMARFDSLTDLPNRAQFREVLTQLTSTGSKFALIYLDLDGFKGVNDTLGHSTGDSLLIAVAKRLRACIREGDFVARLGGDEFAVLQVGGDLQSANHLAERITERLSRTFQIDGVPVAIGASSGVTLSPKDSVNPDELLMWADLALYNGKQGGRGTWRFFEPEMGAKSQERHALQSELRHAIERNELMLHFQPILSLQTGRVVAAEALVRWNHPVRGTIPPNDFIPLAEESGLIVQLGNWVLRQACKEAVTWTRPVRVAVNVSPVQFRSNNLLMCVDDVLRETGLAPERLELEITESVFLDSQRNVLDILHALRERGICIALDDFGTGYSALGYLRAFPFDKVKIDRSFVRELGENPESMAIVNAITGMANSLGMHTTAEGVETSQQATLLRRTGCKQVQGFLFSRPCAPNDIAQFITNDRSNLPEIEFADP